MALGIKMVQCALVRQSTDIASLVAAMSVWEDKLHAGMCQWVLVSGLGSEAAGHRCADYPSHAQLRIAARPGGLAQCIYTHQNEHPHPYIRECIRPGTTELKFLRRAPAKVQQARSHITPHPHRGGCGCGNDIYRAPRCRRKGKQAQCNCHAC